MDWPCYARDFQPLFLPDVSVADTLGSDWDWIGIGLGLYWDWISDIEDIHSFRRLLDKQVSDRIARIASEGAFSYFDFGHLKSKNSKICWTRTRPSVCCARTRPSVCWARTSPNFPHFSQLFPTSPNFPQLLSTFPHFSDIEDIHSFRRCG